MKKYLLLTGICTLLTFRLLLAESDEQRVEKSMWNDPDPEYKTTKCDPKWKNESAVILYKKYNYYVKKPAAGYAVIENVYNHSRLLLNDKAAVEYYSTFSLDITRHTGYMYTDVNNSVFVGVKVIKPNGIERIIPIDKNLIDEIKSGRKKAEYLKVAVPNLEPGDIIDFYIAVESKAKNYTNFVSLHPAILYLAEKYPVQKQKIELTVMRWCYLSAKSLNGAPQLSLEKTDDGQQKWVIVDKDRNRYVDQTYSYKNRDVPLLAFQAASFIPFNAYNNIYFFGDKQDRVKDKILDSDYIEFWKNLNETGSYKGLAKQIIKECKNKIKDETDQNKIIKELYYTAREHLLNANLTYFIANNLRTDNYYENKEFAKLFYTILTLKKLDCSVGLVTPRWLGNINDAVMIPQFDYIVRVNGLKPIYISNFDIYSLKSEIDPDMQGAFVKYVKKSQNSEKTIETETIPISLKTDNVTRYDLGISFDPSDADKLNITRTISASGASKKYFQNNLIKVSDRVKECEKNPLNVNCQKVTQQSALDRVETMKKDGDNKSSENLITDIKDDYGSQNIKNLSSELIQFGMWEENPEFKFKHTFDISDFISKAGKNIIIEAGKLIGTQLQLEKTDSSRLYDIYISYARTTEYSIAIPIPKDYKIKGYEKLNINLKNEAGEFTSTATIEGDSLHIKVSKAFSGNYFPKANWPLIRNIITAANDFRNQKIILTKSGK